MLAVRDRGRTAGRHTRRASRGLVEALGLTTADLDAELAAVVRDPRMPALLALGVVRPNPRPGHIPSSAYESYWDGRAARLIRRTRLEENHPGWLQVFSEANRSDAVHLARHYGLVEEDAVTLIRYLRYGRCDAGFSSPSAEHDTRAVASTEIEDRTVDVITRFVSAHSLSFDAFQELFLNGGLSIGAVAERLGADRAAVALVRELVASVRVVDAATSSLGSEPASGTDPRYDLVGRVLIGPDGGVDVDFVGNTARCGVYEIDWALGRRLCQQSRTDADLMNRIRWLNERSAVIKRVVLALVAYQADYLHSENKLDLAPFAQAELARLLNVATSTVCRALHDKALQLPWGDVQPLLELLPTVRDWVCRLASSDPSLSPREIAAILRNRHGVERGVRVVAHHLQRAALRSSQSMAPEKPPHTR